MPEREFEVEPVGIAYVCDSCGQGEMASAEDVETDEGSQAGWKHRCLNCGHEETLAESYPTIRFRVKGEEQG